MGGIVHFEIPADDQERARGFYQQAFGWNINPIPEMDYSAVTTTPADEKTGAPLQPGAINGGMMARSGELTTPIITVDVEDINAALGAIGELGGSTVQERGAVPGMGYFAYFKDTEGNILGLWQTDPSAGAETGASQEATSEGAAANDMGA
ncbi:VOC family protein [Arthrobacter sp. M4]|uniref:VOC family protein n=1 Tax=Arthrobacter sp. M4 TaxID=218160 RepID=UPI001CDBFE83|nr:VOC family protein [Arthrobacter sp. M4]MCA4132926.1 VOC family protein [Arthrobacter sp. M4]